MAFSLAPVDSRLIPYGHLVWGLSRLVRGDEKLAGSTQVELAGGATGSQGGRYDDNKYNTSWSVGLEWVGGWLKAPMDGWMDGCMERTQERRREIGRAHV